MVLYFFPAAHTAGCNLEARLFSQAAEDFKAQGASIVGVTAGKTGELADFSKGMLQRIGLAQARADGPGL